jgi:putative transcription antitermination factor YqgF
VRVLALDYGSARCGVALSDPTGMLATPLDSVSDPASENGLDEIVRLVDERGVEQVVVGLPVRLAGGEGAQAAEARDFAARLEARVGVPVTTYDERFTTALARRTPGRAPEDSRAAAHLLESYLSAHR